MVAALPAADLAGDGLCVWAAFGGDAAGVDSGLRAAQRSLPEEVRDK
jgi:hypothetical protein